MTDNHQCGEPCSGPEGCIEPPLDYASSSTPRNRSDIHMTPETKTPTATLRTNAMAITYHSAMGNELSTIVGIDEEGDLIMADRAVVTEPTREAALAIAEAFTRLAAELPEAPTND